MILQRADLQRQSLNFLKMNNRNPISATADINQQSSLYIAKFKKNRNPILATASINKQPPLYFVNIMFSLENRIPPRCLFNFQSITFISFFSFNFCIVLFVQSHYWSILIDPGNYPKLIFFFWIGNVLANNNAYKITYILYEKMIMLWYYDQPTWFTNIRYKRFIFAQKAFILQNKLKIVDFEHKSKF